MFSLLGGNTSYHLQPLESAMKLELFVITVLGATIIIEIMKMTLIFHAFLLFSFKSSQGPSMFRVAGGNPWLPPLNDSPARFKRPLM